MFVTFEGIEGSGKSTVMRMLADYLEGCGNQVVITREPGGCGLGRGLRSILLDSRSGRIFPRAELFLFMADRAQHVDEVIRPALDAAQMVFCDRYVDSTFAYQGYGRGENLDNLRAVNSIATGGLLPDLTFLLDLPIQLGLERAGKRNQAQGTVISEGRFDSESLKFHQRVRDGYLELAREDPGRIIVIDAAQKPEMVFANCKKNMPQRQY